MMLTLVSCDECKRSWEIDDEPACECPTDDEWYSRVVEFDDD